MSWEVFDVNQMFVALFPRRGQPAEAPWRLALVTVMQYMEGLSDRQAAEAVRERIDWKYALSLELTDPGFDFSLLSEFRTRRARRGSSKTTPVCPAGVVEGSWLAEPHEGASARIRRMCWRLFASAIDSNVWGKHYVMHGVLLAEGAPDWLLAQTPPEWLDRSSRRFDEYRFLKAHKPNASSWPRRLLLGAPHLFALLS